MVRVPDMNVVPEVSPQELARALESGEPVQVLDVRARARVAAGHIDLVAPGRFHNIAGTQVMTLTALAGTGIDPGLPVIVVCGHGVDSVALVPHLARLGCRASSLRGGMAAWTALVVARDLVPPRAADRFVQLDRVGKGALGYVLASGGEALVVDPPRDATAYLRAVDEAGAKVVAVADTHIHADYISGAPALSRMLDVPYYLHPSDAIHPYDGRAGDVEYTRLENGASLRIGRCTVTAILTPGHTEGSLSYVIDDEAALTGDFVFVASVGRPDLAGKSREWTASLWNSLEAARRQWPDALMIYPAHYGSEDERRPDRTIGASFGELLQRNEALRIADGEAFARWVSSHTAVFPDAYRTIKAVNVGLHRVDDCQAEELEAGRNECALRGARAPGR
jgi:glyoxylase-like metal-dependent hydrolase (beta-lactamase superfamily II)